MIGWYCVLVVDLLGLDVFGVCFGFSDLVCLSYLRAV